MSRVYPAPNYSSTTVLGTSSQRKLVAVSPGTTDSTATIGYGTGTISQPTYYITPEATAAVTALQPVGTASGIGWGLVASDSSSLVPLSADGFALSAGTMTVTVYASRDGGLTSADVTATMTAILFRATAGLASFPQELGRTTASPVVITTTKAAFNIVVATAAATFNPGDIVWLEVCVYATAGSVTTTNVTYQTNSTASMQISASTCTYTTLFNRTISDSMPVSDTITRTVTSHRTLADSMPVSDSVKAATTYARTLTDALATGGGATTYIRPVLLFEG